MPKRKRLSSLSKNNPPNIKFSFSAFVLLPTDMQNHIATYLDDETLLAYAMTSKEKLKQTQSELKRRSQNLSLLKIMPKETATFLLADNKLYVCGVNNGNILGFGDNKTRHEFEQIPGIKGIIQDVVAGDRFIIVVTDQGLYGCGVSDEGQLGVYDKEYADRIRFQKLTSVSGNVQQIVSGDNHTVILTDQGLYGAGSNSIGQLGFGKTSKIKSFTQLTHITGNVKQIAAGRDYTLVLTDQGLYGAGYNYWGQLGIENLNSIKEFKQLTSVPNNIQQVMASGDSTFILADAGLYAAGRQSWGQYGLGDKDERPRKTFTKISEVPKNIKQLVVADEHTMILTKEGRLYTCGNNEGGRLGLGNTTSKNKFTQVKNVPGTIQQILASRYLSFIWTEKGLYATGNNAWVQLPWKEKELELRYKDHISSMLNFKPVKNIPDAAKICWKKYQRFDRLIQSHNIFEKKKHTFFPLKHPKAVTPSTSEITTDLNNQPPQQHKKPV